MDNLEWLRGQCNRYLNGVCQNSACLRRGGYVRWQTPVNYETATCHAKEVLDKIERHCAALEKIAAAGPAEGLKVDVSGSTEAAFEKYGFEQGQFEAAEIARAALKEEK